MRFAVPLFALAFTAALPALADVPTGWTCDPGFFGADDGCDCGCGAPDTDCKDATLASCEFDLTCEDAGQVPSAADPTLCVANTCGDGVRGGDETCDDGDGAGCSADCATPADGQTCGLVGCHTSNVCGDGFLDLDEECDDGVTPPVAGDGCDATCHQEDGFVCPQHAHGGACHAIVCGDGHVDGAEECDDGVTPPVAGDGCDATCNVEPGFVCDTDGAPCRAIVCGDGLVDGDEECDDGVTPPVAGDGCDASCVTEANFSCSGEPSVCTAIPAGWTCTPGFFGSDDGCDCGCGVADPDCAGSSDPADCLDDFCADGETVSSTDISQCVAGAGEGEGEGAAGGEGEGAAAGEGEGAGREGEGEGEGSTGGGCSSVPVSSSTMPAAVVLVGALGAMFVRRRRR